MNQATNTGVEIRDEVNADIGGIRRVHESAFDTPAEADLVDLLRAHGRAFISLVAESKGEIVGHILFSPVTIEPPQPGWNALGLAPLAVLPDHQRMGTGAALSEQGLARCRELGTHLVVVLGDPAYYARFGFRRARDFGLDNEYQADEHFMALALTPGALQQFNGLVKYAPEFNQTGT